ncbi:hypothetical protein BIFGAL_02999 [Bifidobacterium gallicum DSM 20093 = LMG 11596]|uniref:Uncharacterized protein n=1 Tax=Bifidobacterium gallicum DSM 20093 = LMG 11596 TaxID=561180 RepID=D1NT88_9BIFI|nr:hypothetical protein BIFGAL_02999 [Bifidobacterium gallicum DSM 20093 = LMG 11596]
MFCHDSSKPRPCAGRNTIISSVSSLTEDSLGIRPNTQDNGGNRAQPSPQRATKRTMPPRLESQDGIA